MRRRSLREIGFRLAQEVRNAAWFLRPPRVSEPGISPLPFPDGRKVAEMLRGTRFAEETLQRAKALMRGEIELFGRVVRFDREIEWRKDFLSGKSAGLEYFRRIPYLDFERAGDHKVIWELNRHQHLVVLAQAWLFSGERKFLDEIERQIESWIAQNPFVRGINWASALEVAFRALSWLWISHLAGADLKPQFHRTLLRHLYLHGLFLRRNLSLYFSPNTHLTGEATALHALGCLFSRPDWKRTGAAVMNRELLRQNCDDGSYFEQSTYYQVYSLDIFLFHALLRPVNESYRGRLARMSDFLDALLGSRRQIPLFGDDDGGRFFHPYGERRSFGRASVAAASLYLGRSDLEFSEEDSRELAAWWLGATGAAAAGSRAGRLFAESGLAILHKDGWQLTMDAGPFGPPPSGHSHADTLSFTLSSPAGDVLIDPGTYTYVADPAERNRFRGTAMHNTIRIGGRDQAEAAGPFGWRHAPKVLLRRFSPNGIAAECRYRGFVHRREIAWGKPSEIVVIDEVTGPAGSHAIEQFWHSGVRMERTAPDRVRIGKQVEMIFPAAFEMTRGGEFGWLSPVYAAKEECGVIRVHWEATLPWRAETILRLT